MNFLKNNFYFYFNNINLNIYSNYFSFNTIKLKISIYELLIGEFLFLIYLNLKKKACIYKFKKKALYGGKNLSSELDHCYGTFTAPSTCTVLFTQYPPRV